MKNKLCLALLMCLSAYPLLNAQQYDVRIASTRLPVEEVDQAVMPPLDNEALLQAELERRQPGVAPRFAKHIEVDISPEDRGAWETLPNGKSVWRLRVLSAGAHSINLGFTRYGMPEGGTLILYSPDKKRVMGPFTPADNEEHEQLWTPVFEGDELVIEVQLPTAKRSALQLRLSSVNHDFLGFAEVVSGSCNLDVVCGGADGWEIVDRYRDIIQSVAVIGLDGGTFCTGFLVNNARNDCAPLFMTAAHCGIGPNNAASLVAYWNFQNSSCRQPNSPQSGGAGNGTLNDFNTGAKHLASYSPSDFTLVEFDDPVSETANAFFAGWVVDDTPPQDTVICVHHPSTDEKRISFEFGPTHIGDWGSGGDVVPGGDHVIVPDWDIGTTEGGSSGSPLFDREGHVVGQLHGGGAACGNNDYDSYGWFYTSWEGGGTPSTRLKDWLDPDDTGITRLEGRSQMACSFFVAPAIPFQVACSPDSVVFGLAVSENFTGEVNISLNSVPAGIEAVLSSNPALPGDTVQLTLYNTATLPTGTYSIDIIGTDQIETSENPIQLTVFSGIPDTVQLSTPADGVEDWTIFPTFQWEEQADAIYYEFELATSLDFDDILVAVGGLTVNDVTGLHLDPQTDYYWRVRAVNTCGAGEWAAASSFTTAAIICSPETSTDVPVAISESGTPTITSSIEVNLPGEIIEVQVLNLDISHTWVGDLRATLISPTGTEVVLFDRPGVPTSSFGCDGDNLLLNIFETAPNSSQDLDNSCGNQPAISGSFQPAQSLSNFGGEPISGTWTLSISDNAAIDGGALNGWELNFCAALPADASLTPLEDQHTFCTTEDYSFDILLGTGFDEGGVHLSATGLPAGAAASFSDTLASPGATVTVTLSGLTDPGTYTITLEGADSTNVGSADIGLTILGAPDPFPLLLPADGATDVPLNPLLSWEASPSALSYTVEVATDPDFTNILVANTQESNVFNLDGLLNGTTYYWRVAATNECGTLEASAASSFVTVPDLSFLINPLSVEACPSEIASFELAIGAGFGRPSSLSFTSEPAAELSATYSAGPDGIEPPATIAVNFETLGDITPGSYTITFTIEDGANLETVEADLLIQPLPAAPGLDGPANGAALMDLMPTLTWEQAANAESYLVQVSTDEDFFNIVDEADVTGTTAYTVDVMLDAGLYYWRVSAENECGDASSAIRTFTVQPSSTAELNGQTVRFAPNPTKGDFQILFSGPLPGQLTVEVFSLDGRRLLVQEPEAGSTAVTVNLADYPAGGYLVRLKNEEAVLVRRVLVQK